MIRFIEKNLFPTMDSDQGHRRAMILVTTSLSIVLGSGVVGAAIYFLNKAVTFGL
jgi:hypothetical protein